MRKLLTALAATLLLAACTKVPEVGYKVWYNWPERYLPDFSALGGPDLCGQTDNFDLEDLDETRNHFCAQFESYLSVKTEEEYLFTLTTDDGSRLYVDGELLIVNDGAHGAIEKKASKILSKGRHSLRIDYFDYDKGQSMVFKYSTPSIPEREFRGDLMAKEDRITSRRRFVRPQVKKALARYKEWKGDDETIVYPILTDIHTAGRFSYKHIGYAAVAAKAFGADFMANLGDIGLNAYPATVDSLYAREILRNVRSEMDKYDGVWIYAPGNHDWDAGGGRYLSEQFLTDYFQKPWEKRAGGNLHLTPGKTYGYYDIPAKNFRIIFLNSQGTGTQGGCYYIFDEAQLDWLQSVLDATPDDMTVIVTAHYMPHPMGRWTIGNASQHSLGLNEKLMGILSAFKARGGSLAGMICGDTHANYYTEYNGVNYFISQGYGWVVPDLMLPGQTHAFFKYQDNLCIDVVAVKPSAREVHTLRIGAGGADFDICFRY